MSAHSPTSKMEDHHSSSVCDYIFNIFATTFHIRRPSVHPQPEDEPRRGDRDPLIMENSHLLYRKNKLSFRYKVKNKTAHAINPLNAELNPICHLLALLGAHHILHVSRVRVKYHAQQRTVKSTLNSAHTKHQKKVNSQV